MQGNSAEAIGGGSRRETAPGDAEPVLNPLWRLLELLALATLFVTTVLPIGLAMRALGKDPLRLRRDQGAASYWVARDPAGPAPGSMTHQS